MNVKEQITWKVVKEAGEPLYHLSLIYPWAERIGAPACNVRMSLDEDELRSLQDAIAEIDRTSSAATSRWKGWRTEFVGLRAFLWLLLAGRRVKRLGATLTALRLFPDRENPLIRETIRGYIARGKEAQDG